jgi:dihydropyrimidinase
VDGRDKPGHDEGEVGQRNLTDQGPTMDFELLIRNGTAVFPDCGVMPADIGCSGGKVTAILAPGQPVGEAKETVDATGLHVFPGFIDSHVHFGFAEPVVEYTTETVYAAQGGVTTVVGYFLKSDSYRNLFAEARAAAEARAHVDFAFHLSTATEAHLQEMGEYVAEFGITSFKYFMNFKGEEGRYMGLDGTDDGFFWDLLQEAARLKEPLIVCHTENIEIVNRVRRRFQAEGRTTLRDWSLSKPPVTEAENLVRAMWMAEKTGARIYIPHVSAALSLEEYRKWQARYANVFLETCPHYLTHDLDADLGGLGKANPPFRTREDIDALWAALADGTVQVLASDHVPRKRATKEKGVWQASQGFPGTATILPVALSEGYHKGRLSLQRLAQVYCSEPARIFDLGPAKGNIRIGGDADLTLVDLARELGSHSDYSLYEGWRLSGWPVRTIVRGLTVMQDHKVVGAGGHGKYIARRHRG